jgi:hypothetical protein
MNKQNDQVLLAMVATAPALVDSFSGLVREMRPIIMLALWLYC